LRRRSGTAAFGQIILPAFSSLSDGEQCAIELHHQSPAGWIEQLLDVFSEFPCIMRLAELGSIAERLGLLAGNASE
jgi:hypothetical protein